ncbi:MAG: NAD-dependent DNA ligase LigA [Bacteroidales bacterium]|jgi:DNA ligase (NAD+)|nr:NAD-dependent DNA ligase LigA [Bacteroidales bacterium]
MSQLYNKIIELRQQINRHNYNYYVLDNPTVDDQTFDFLLKELEALEEEYKKENPNFDKEFFSLSPTQRVGGEVSKNFTQVEHSFPMLSLANTYSIEEIKDFVKRAEDSLSLKDALQWVCELKYDGVAVSLNYVNGKLQRALTRGDGIRGDDITKNIKTINSIPLELIGEDYPEEFEIRGEVIFPLKEFEKFNNQRIIDEQEPLANPRNAASGSIKLLDSRETAKRHLECFLYFLLLKEDNTNDKINEEILSLTHYQRLQRAKQWGFNIPKFMAICNSIEEITEFINYWDKERFNLDFNIDGIVIKLNDTKLWNVLGATNKTPRWATAYKFKAQREETKLISVEYQVGRTGIVTPVANFEPISLGGTIVKRASLHNEEFIQKLSLAYNDYIYIEKGGEIIPKVVGINFDKREKREGEIEYIKYIKNCPICNTPLIKEESEAGYYCPNYNHCPSQILGRMQHFVSKKAMNIAFLGEERLKYLLDNNLISNFYDIYDLKKEELIGLTSLDEDKKSVIQKKGAENIIEAILLSKDVPFERVLFALGIRYVGEVLAKKIAKTYKSIDNIIGAKKEDLLQIDEVGERIAQSIVSYFSNEENISLINELKKRGLNFEIKETFLSNKLLGKSFVVSGTFETFSRDSIKKAIEDNQGRVLSGISSKLNYLLAGEKMGEEKRKKAEKLNIPIISEKDFIEMLNN